MIIYGVNPVREALRSSQPPNQVWLELKRDNPRQAEIAHLADHLRIPLQRLPDLDRLTGSREHQGCAADLGERHPLSLDELPEDCSRLVMLDGLQDPQNFGAALRVCEVFGVPDIVYHRGNSCGVTPAAIKASAGAFCHLRLYESNLNRACQRLHERGYTMAILEAQGDVSLPDWHPTGKVCLVMGSEGGGVRFNLRRQGDLRVSIPMAGKVDSLNVSCALAVALYQFTR